MNGTFSRIKGYVCVVIAALTWASSGATGKVLFLQGMTPFELVQVRLTFSALILAAVMAFVKPSALRIRARDIGYFFVLGGLGMAFMNLAYFYAISKIQVAAAILLQYLAPVLVAVFSFVFWREKFDTLKIFALIFALGGCYLTVGGYNLGLLQLNRNGIMGGLGAAVCFSAYSLLGERGMHTYSPWTVLLYALVFGTVTWHILLTPFHYLTAGYTAFQWVLLMHIVIIGTLVPFGLYYIGINYIRSTRAIITATLEPIIAGFMAYVLVKEIMEPLQILGGAFVIGAIVLLQFSKEQEHLSPQAIRADSQSTG